MKLTQRCLQMLKPNGVLLFANFARDIGEDGYMETFMNWALLLRSEADMWSIINASVDRNTVEASVHFGANRNIVYGIIRETRMSPAAFGPPGCEPRQRRNSGASIAKGRAAAPLTSTSRAASRPFGIEVQKPK